MFYVDILRAPDCIEVRIKKEDLHFAAGISVYAIGEMNDLERVRIFIKPNASFHNEMSATEARDVARWFDAAAQVADKLAGRIRERGDLKRRVTAAGGAMVGIHIGDLDDERDSARIDKAHLEMMERIGKRR